MKISYKILATLFTMFSCLNMSAQNLVNMDDWVSGTSGATINYNLQGSATQNSRITMTGPYGNQVTVWEASADGSAGMNGGFEHSGIVVDTDKTYRISFWVRSTGSSNCNNNTGFTPYYTGGGLVQPFDNENGGSVSWPYTSSRNQPNDKWFLIVGYVRPSSANDLGDSGIYDPSQGTAPNFPSPSYSTTDFIFPSTVSQINIRIRSFMWACASGEKMFVYDPRLEEVSNVTPLSNLLYGSNTADTQSPTTPSLSSTAHTQTTASLSWSGATDNVGVTEYRIFKDGVLETTLGNVTSYQVTELTAATSYDFMAISLDAAGNESPSSNTVSVTTDDSGGSSGGSTVWNESSSDISYTNGNVGIGSNAIANYKLAVDGKIRSREVKVDNDNWADYVFLKDYQLPTLQEVEQHIQEKGHLINIPSATEVATNGIELGEMNKLLLEKIEELTLYILEQNKELKVEKELDLKQEKQLKELKARLQKIEKLIKLK